jgi:signal transduction histidine kinase
MVNFRHWLLRSCCFLLLMHSGVTGLAQSAAAVDSVVQESRSQPPSAAIANLTAYLGQMSDLSFAPVIHDRISDAFLELGYLDSAAVHAWHVLRQAPENTRLCSRAYVRLGFISYQREAFERAEDFYHRASRQLTILDDKPALLMSLAYEARVLEHLDRTAEALPLYKQAIGLAAAQQDKSIELQLNFEMAGIMRKIGSHSDAEDIFLKLISHSGWDSARMALVWNELGAVYEARDDYRRASDAYLHFLNHLRETDPFPGYHQLLRMFIRLDQLDTAALYADSAEAAAMASGQISYLRDCFRERHALARRRKDTVEAYGYLLKYKIYDDSLQHEAAARNVQRVKDEQIISASEALVRIAELEAQGKERTDRVRRNEERFLWISIGSSMAAVLFLSLWYFTRQRSRERLRNQQEQINDLSAKNSKVFGVLAQDLQGPLSIFSNLTRSMPSQLKQATPAEAAELLKHLHRSSQEVQQSLHEMLDWAITQSGTMPFRPEFFSCRSLAEQVVKELEPWAAEHGVVPMLLVPEHVTTFADRTMVRMVLRTLLYNAIRFSPDGAAVSVFSGKRDNLITMGVKDHGPGIEAGKLNSILNWSDADGRERGVGLPMCRELVRRNGGELFVESEVGQGSTFFFTLPENPPGVA